MLGSARPPSPFSNSPHSVDGQWYLFILEEIDGAIYTIAHATRPELVGTTRVRVDSRGFDYGAAFAATTEAGHWVDYVFLNPAISAEQLKHTWIIRHDGLLFGSGWYENAPDESSSAADGGAVQDPAGFTVNFVKQALRCYDADGREATLAYYSSPQSADGEWYTFLFEDGIAVGHPDQDVLGQDLRGDLGVDPTGYRFGDVILGVIDEGRWVRLRLPQSRHRRGRSETRLGRASRWLDLRLWLVRKTPTEDRKCTSAPTDWSPRPSATRNAVHARTSASEKRSAGAAPRPGRAAPAPLQRRAAGRSAP